MNLTARLVPKLLIVLLSFCSAGRLWPQASGVVVSGIVTDSSGKPIQGASISVKNVATGQLTEAQTDSAGKYSVSDLPAGNYEISVAASEFETKTATLLLTPGNEHTFNATLAASFTPGAPSLADLGLSPSQTKGSSEYQKLLDRRSHMLQVHQRLGLIATAPMIASLFTSTGAKGHHGMPGSASGRDLHTVLGAATADLYFTSAYFAIRAPKVPGVETHGPIRVHKALAWIHGPGMILTPILGAIAYNQLSNNERVHGIAKYHSDVAAVTAAAYGAAIISVSVRF